MASQEIEENVKTRTDSFRSDEDRRRAKLCEDALSIYSPSGDEKAFATFLYTELKSRGLEPVMDGAGNVLCMTGSGKPSMLLCGHMDTVPGILKVRREGDTLFGRGACDAKGALLSMLFAFEEIATELREGEREEGHGRVIFAGVTEEERGSAGLSEIIKNKVKADGAIFGEPCGANKVTIGYRGHVPVSVQVFTSEAHGSAPWLAPNAALVAFSFYEKTKEIWPEERSSERVSVALTEIHAGSVHNVTPGHAQLSLDVRVPVGVLVEEVKSNLRKIEQEFNAKSSPETQRVSLEFGDSTEPYKTRLDSNLLRAVNRAVLKSGMKPEHVAKSGTGDMNSYALAFGVDALTYGPGDTKLSHTQEEKVSIEEIFTCSKIMKLSVIEFFSLCEKEEKK